MLAEGCILIDITLIIYSPGRANEAGQQNSENNSILNLLKSIFINCHNNIMYAIQKIQKS
jgi:hypothetical protein